MVTMPEVVWTWALWTDRLKPDAADALFFARGCSRSPTRVRRWQAEHLLLMSLLDSASSACLLLRRCGVDPTDVEREVRRRVKQPNASGHTDCAPVLEAAFAEASALGENKIGTEHIVLAVLQCEGPGGDVLRGVGLKEDSVRGVMATKRNISS